VDTVIITAIRVLGSLPVLRWAWAGAWIAILVDLSDLFLKNIFDLGPDYQTWDKYVDQVYLALFMVVAFRWDVIPAAIAGALYGYRMAGFIVFEIVEERWLLLVYPNLFEFWFVFVAGVLHFGVNFRYTARNVALVLAGLLALKMFQEYALHQGRWLDGFSAFEAVEAIWDWVTAPF
jgi:hypothetical protein